MQKNWQRGLLLGVSMALLLGAGVALAQGLSITVTPEGCVECFTRPQDATWLSVSSSGWQMDERINYYAWVDGAYFGPCISCGVAVGGQHTDTMFHMHPCPGAELPPEPPPPASVFDVVAQNTIPDYLGKWTYKLEGATSGQWGEFQILVARDCALATFVPEPGSILLLGSGLAGLAGYAALRWRARE